jgi:DNA-binding LacI/PurR family transcriptional regulator
MSVTIKDVAERAGVSTTTVSRVLNGRESGLPIREETRRKVHAIAAELGYRPNLMARALRGSRTSLIGVLAQNITSLFHSQILRGLNEVAGQRAYRVFLGHVHRQLEVAVDYSSMFEQSHADGILIMGELAGDEAALETLLRQHRYVVGVSDRSERRSFPGVYADSVVGTQLALDHLWELGHRRIICVTDPNLEDARLRREVYERYMKERHATEFVRIVPTSRSFEASAKTGLDIFANLEAFGHPTAIFAATDVIAVGLLQAAYQSHVTVPDQISIVGFDDLDIAPFTIPPLTTIRQSGVTMGQVAAKLLMDMIEQELDGAQVDDIVLIPTLVVRQSTARLLPTSA